MQWIAQHLPRLIVRGQMNVWKERRFHRRIIFLTARPIIIFEFSIKELVTSGYLPIIDHFGTNANFYVNKKLLVYYKLIIYAEKFAYKILSRPNLVLSD